MCYTYRMNIEKGIIGIRNLISDNKCGWHIILNDQYSNYNKYSFVTVVTEYSEHNWTLVGVVGNTMHFRNGWYNDTLFPLTGNPES